MWEDNYSVAFQKLTVLLNKEAQVIFEVKYTYFGVSLSFIQRFYHDQSNDQIISNDGAAKLY